MIKYYFIALLLFSNVYAQTFRIERPVRDRFETNGGYLYAEPRIYDKNLGHTGIDVRIAYDSIFSATDGIVDFVGYNPADSLGGYEPTGGGNYIRVKSTYAGKSLYLYYMHLEEPRVAVNDVVTKGKFIAISGNTGNSTGPHLHFEIRQGATSGNRTRRNPELWCSMTGMGAIYGTIPGAANSTRFDISPNPKPRPPYTTFTYGITYNFNDPVIGSDEVYKENYAIGDVKPGTYVITSGTTYRRTVTVKAGEVVNADAITSIDDEFIASNYQLMQNYPNPFNPYTEIEFTLPESGYTELKVYNMLGETAAELVNEELTSGKHRVTFDGSSLPSGMYIYTIRTSNFTKSMKMMLVK